MSISVYTIKWVKVMVIFNIQAMKIIIILDNSVSINRINIINSNNKIHKGIIINNPNPTVENINIDILKYIGNITHMANGI